MKIQNFIAKERIFFGFGIHFWCGGNPVLPARAFIFALWLFFWDFGCRFVECLPSAFKRCSGGLFCGIFMEFSKM